MSKTPGWTLLCATLLLGAACDDPAGTPDPVRGDGPTAPPGPVPQLLSIGISEPAAAAVAVAQGNPAPASAAFAYVAFAEGELGAAVSVRIGNATTGTIDQTVYPVIAGGLDPVAVAASVGDTIQLEATYLDAGVAFIRMLVPERRPPRVIRTSPTKGRTDVALNSVVVVVFSEPIDVRTVTTETVHLSCRGTPVPGALQLVSSLATAFQFVPDGDLPGSATCRLAVNAGVQDLGGDALEGSLDVEFHTAGTTGRPTPPTPPTPLPIQGVFERETPHRAPGAHSRYVMGDDGRFEMYYLNGRDSTVLSGRWTAVSGGGGMAGARAASLILDFDDFQDTAPCGVDGFGTYHEDGYLAIAYCGVMIAAGFEEGVYAVTPGPHLQPSPSQDGQLAFVRDGRIHVVNADGSGVRPLTDGPYDRSPAWSPDGRRLAFLRVIGGESSVHVMDADGSNVIQRTSPQPVGLDAPTWSPDGRWIAFVCRSGGNDICMMPADGDGTAPFRITSHGGQVSAPSWSPDGTRIAFGSDWSAYDFLSDIWVVTPDGSQLTNLSRNDLFTEAWRWHHQPAWSPDGQRIAFVACPSWSWHNCSSAVIGVMNADGAGSVLLPATSGFVYPEWAPYGEFIHPQWSPDGQVIAFGSLNGIEWVSADGSARGLIIRDGHSPAWRP